MIYLIEIIKYFYHTIKYFIFITTKVGCLICVQIRSKNKIIKSVESKEKNSHKFLVLLSLKIHLLEPRKVMLELTYPWGCTSLPLVLFGLINGVPVWHSRGWSLIFLSLCFCFCFSIDINFYLFLPQQYWDLIHGFYNFVSILQKNA